MPALVFGLLDHSTVRAKEVWTWRSCCTTVSARPTRHRSAMSSFHDTSGQLGVCAFSGSLRGLELVPLKWRCLVPPTSGYPMRNTRDRSQAVGLLSAKGSRTNEHQDHARIRI